METVQIWILTGVVAFLILAIRLMVGWIMKKNETNYTKVTCKIDELIVSMNQLSITIATEKEVIKNVISEQARISKDVKAVSERIRIVENRQLGCKNFTPKIHDNEV